MKTIKYIKKSPQKALNCLIASRCLNLSNMRGLYEKW